MSAGHFSLLLFLVFGDLAWGVPSPNSRQWIAYANQRLSQAAAKLTQTGASTPHCPARVISYFQSVHREIDNEATQRPTLSRSDLIDSLKGRLNPQNWRDWKHAHSLLGALEILTEESDLATLTHLLDEEFYAEERLVRFALRQGMQSLGERFEGRLRNDYLAGKSVSEGNLTALSSVLTRKIEVTVKMEFFHHALTAQMAEEDSPIGIANEVITEAARRARGEHLFLFSLGMGTYTGPRFPDADPQALAHPERYAERHLLERKNLPAIFREHVERALKLHAQAPALHLEEPLAHYLKALAQLVASLETIPRPR
jgi:hypothetical protein